MAALHLVQWKLDPVQEPVSFYVHGNQGWLLPLALGFFGLAALALATLVATRSLQRLLRAFALCMLTTAVVPSDRWFPWEAAPTGGGLVHGAAAVIAPLLLLVVMWAVRQHHESMARIETTLMASYLLTLIGCGVSLAVGFVRDVAPPFIGIAERVLAVSAVAWIARIAIRPGPIAPVEQSGRPGARSQQRNLEYGEAPQA